MPLPTRPETPGFARTLTVDMVDISDTNRPVFTVEGARKVEYDSPHGFAQIVITVYRDAVRVFARHDDADGERADGFQRIADRYGSLTLSAHDWAITAR